MSIKIDSFGELQRITLDNELVRAIVLPDLGGKMISLVRLAGGHEFLLQMPEPERGYRRGVYGDAFEEYDTSGFDDCMPTVAECVYPDDEFKGVVLPDHGEVWSAPWSCDIDGEVLSMWTSGRGLPYTLSKRLRLEGARLIIDYEVENLSDQAFKYLWSAHPLLAVNPGDRVVLPEEVNELFVHWSKDDRLGPHGQSCGWPVAIQINGQADDLSIIKPPSAGWAEKLFTSRLTTGHCALYSTTSGESIGFHFDPELVPFVGLWICQGGWPTSRAAKHYTVALEPCNGRPDSLAEASARGECEILPARAIKRWALRLEV
jgi:hypothetical protein